MKLRNIKHSDLYSPRGMSLIEIALVIALMLSLTVVTWMSFSPFRNWQRAKDAGISLQAVYTAQKAFLADHPTSPTIPNITLNGAVITDVQLQPYLPGSTVGALAPMPTAVDINGNPLTIDFTVIPPVLKNGGGSVYSGPAGNPTDDGLWDIGKP